MSKERKIIEGQINDHQEAIDKAKEKLKALDEPKLEQGDYNIEQGLIAHMIAPMHPRQTHLAWRNKDGLIPGEYLETTKLKKDGNFYDHLQRLSEPLEEFEKQVHGDNIFGAKQVYDNKIRLKIRTDGSDDWKVATGTLPEIKEIIDDLTRVYHTAKKNQESK